MADDSKIEVELGARIDTFLAGLAEASSALEATADAISQRLANVNAALVATAGTMRSGLKAGFDGTERDAAGALQSLDGKFAAAAEQQRKILAQQQRDQQKAWAAVVNPIQHTLTTITDGILQGAQTWQQVFKRALSEIVTAFAQAVEQMIVKWLEFEALGIGSNPFAAGAGGLGGLIGSLLGGGGGVGTAAGEGLGSTLLSFASFDVGAWSIPRDMLALVHQGEMVVPANDAAYARSGGGIPSFAAGAARAGASAGGPAVNINIAANMIDGKGFQALANQYAPQLASAVQRHLTLNPSARGAY